MIIGIFDDTSSREELIQGLAGAQFHQGANASPKAAGTWSRDGIVMSSVPRGIETLDESPQPFTNEDESVAVVFEGKIHNVHEIKQRLGSRADFRTTCSGEALVHLYSVYQEQFLEGVNGKFAFALWDARRRRLILGRDQLGIESLFYTCNQRQLIFCSSLRSLTSLSHVAKRINRQAVLQFLLYGYNPLEETVFCDIRKLPAAHLLTWGSSEESLRRYWQLSFAEAGAVSEKQCQDEFLDLMRDAIRIRLEKNRAPAVLLSGGTDSSAILALTSSLSDRPIQTYSFRCEGPSYDESTYARFVADHFGAVYNEVRYGPDSITQIQNVVAAMDEPFCDIGIELATFLLGRAAQGTASYVFNGEGGDELFAGHPVYVADKAAAYVEWVPKFLRAPVTGLLQRIPDNDEKKNLKVMLKRFSYGLSFPRQLMSHRWRVYYTISELRKLCTDEFISSCDLSNLFDGMMRYSRSADGKDSLSRSLYSDFHTLIDFYLRRLALLRASSIESRPPLMDIRLVEYAAKIESNLKIRGWSDTKYVYRKTLDPILPKKILHDRPKLGHSVPMKNWLRDDPTVVQWAADILTDASFQRSGLFRTEYVYDLIDSHRKKTHNQSHRLWELCIFSLWLHSFTNSSEWGFRMHDKHIDVIGAR